MFDNYSKIPSDLKDLNQWVVWKADKHPYSARNGRSASSTDAATWSTFDDAMTASAAYSGIGFVFSKEDGLVGIDIDHCRNPDTGEIMPWAKAIVDAFPTYWEISPSGTGLHGIAFAPKPARGRRPTGTQIEIYGSGRYFTVTGNHLQDTALGIKDCSEPLAKLLDELDHSGAARQQSIGEPADTSDELDDDEIIELARRAKNSTKFLTLFDDGDVSSYGNDDSAADLALCSILAFHCGRGGQTQVDRLFRRSALFREKWDRKTGDSTYGQMTIAKAYEHPAESHETATTSFTFETYQSRTTRPSSPAPISADGYYGIVGRIVEQITPHTESSPAGILIQILVAIGNIIGHGPNFVVEATEHYANLFACLVGKTARGRKGTAWAYPYALSKHIDREWCENRVETGLTTGEGLIHLVRDEIRQTVKGKQTIVDHGVDDKRLLAIESEFAKVLSSTARHDNNLSAVIRQAWDSGTLKSLSKTNPSRATNAHVSIIGHITKEELHKLLSDTQLFNGFANRFLWVYTERTQLLPDGGNLPDSVAYVRRRVETNCRHCQVDNADDTR